MFSMNKCNYIISTIFIVLGGAISFVSLHYGTGIDSTGTPGPGFWPFLLGSLMIILAIVLLMSSLRQKEAEAEQVELNTADTKRVYATMLIIVAFCFLLYFLGFYLAILVFIPSIMYLLQVRKILTIVLTTIITVGAIHLIFSVLLNVSFPMLIFMR